MIKGNPRRGHDGISIMGVNYDSDILKIRVFCFFTKASIY